MTNTAHTPALLRIETLMAMSQSDILKSCSCAEQHVAVVWLLLVALLPMRVVACDPLPGSELVWGCQGF